MIISIQPSFGVSVMSAISPVNVDVRTQASKRFSLVRVTQGPMSEGSFEVLEKLHCQGEVVKLKAERSEMQTILSGALEECSELHIKLSVVRAELVEARFKQKELMEELQEAKHNCNFLQAQVLEVSKGLEVEDSFVSESESVADVKKKCEESLRVKEHALMSMGTIQRSQVSEISRLRDRCQIFASCLGRSFEECRCEF